jgi:hypothetical protein
MLRRQAELDTLARTVAEFHGNVEFRNIRLRLKTGTSRRTIQRRLTALVAHGRLIPVGKDEA